MLSHVLSVNAVCRYDFSQALWPEQGLSTITVAITGSTATLAFVQDAWVLAAWKMSEGPQLAGLVLELADLARRNGWELDMLEHLSLLPFCMGPTTLRGQAHKVECSVQKLRRIRAMRPCRFGNAKRLGAEHAGAYVPAALLHGAHRPARAGTQGELRTPKDY